MVSAGQVVMNLPATDQASCSAALGDGGRAHETYKHAHNNILVRVNQGQGNGMGGSDEDTLPHLPFFQKYLNL